MKRKLLYSMLLVFAGGIAIAQNNTSTGTNAGNGTNGYQNASYGYYAGDIITGNLNSFYGSYSGSLMTSGEYNAFYGAYSGRASTTSIYNAFFGASTGESNTTGNSNTFVGYATGYNNTTGSSNSFLGRGAGFANTTGYSNSFIGQTSGRFNSTGYYNTALGFESMFYNSTGTNNLILGYQAGYSATAASGNVFIGSQAGYSETTSNKLYIDNSNTASPLIWGDFTNNYLNINGSLAVGTTTPSDNFHVVGTARFASLTQDNAQTRVMVTNTNGKVFWRDASSLAVGDNLGNHIATQSITASANNSYDIGSAAANFKDIYFGGKLFVGSTQFFKVAGVGAGTSVYIGEDAGTAHTVNATLNVSLGYHSLAANTDGDYNVAIGANALEDNNTGLINTAVGGHAMMNTTTGYSNVAVGFNTLTANTTGNINTAVGAGAMEYNTTGYGNTAVGLSALHDNTTGICNTAVGYTAAFSGNYSNATAIGYDATVTVSNSVVIGDVNVTSIGGYANWTNLSDGRFKKNIRKDVHGLDFIRKLNPVTYTLDVNKLNTFLGKKSEQNTASMATAEARSKKEGNTYNGFIAQEVEKAAQEINYAFSGVVKPSGDRDHYRISYSDFVVPLVKAVQELDTKVTAQQALIDEQRQLIDKQQQMLTALMDRMSTATAEPATPGTVLYQNHPNPFRNGETEITMDIPENVNSATITVYDMNGKTIDRVTVTARGKGVSVKAGGGKMTSGIYLYSLTVDGRIAGVNKMAAE